MYTIQENVRIVIAMLKQYGIRHIVVNPGGTNISVARAVQEDSFFRCYSVPDERSAMYFAIGLHLQTGEVIAISCTSAQATRNFVPGLTEAFYKHTPILAITTSKLKRFEYQEYMQAPEQCSLPRDAVKSSFDLPPVTDENTRRQCHQAVRNAIMETTHRSGGPVQLNLRIVDTQQSQFEEVELPDVRPLKRYMAWDDWGRLPLDGKKVLVVVGEHRPFDERQKRALDAFCESYNAVVYVSHLSNYDGPYAIQANLLVSSGGFSYLKPDVLITIGGQTGDYSIYGALQGIGYAEHWRVSPEGDLVDTYGHLARIFECPDFYFFERTTAETSTEDHSYFAAWQQLQGKLNFEVPDLPFSNLYAAQQLYKQIPHGSMMNFAILNSLRCWSYFPLHPSIQGYANVAAFGIDGCNSMLIGESMETEELCFIVTGDLAFFYDMNSLGIRHIKPNVRVLLINNGGGGEFKIMTRNWQNRPDVGPFISANGHNGNAKGWAENCGFDYMAAHDKTEFGACCERFVSSSERPLLLEMFTDEDDDAAAVSLFLKKNNELMPKTLKEVVSGMVGAKGVRVIKSILGK